MGFRQDNKYKMLWKRFIRNNRELILRSGVPIGIAEDLDLFEDLLMHGYIDHHPDPLGFTLRNLTRPQYDAFLELLDKYFEAGLQDPGMGAISHEDQLKLARKHPQALGHWLKVLDSESDS